MVVQVVPWMKVSSWLGGGGGEDRLKQALLPARRKGYH